MREPAPQNQQRRSRSRTASPRRPSPAGSAPAPAPGSTDPIKPNLVKTLTVKASASQTASLAPVSLLSPMPVTSQTHAALAARSEPELPPPPPGAKPGVLGVLSTQAVAAPAPVRRSPHPSPHAAPKPQPVYASAGAPPPRSAPRRPFRRRRLPPPRPRSPFHPKASRAAAGSSRSALTKTSPKRARNSSTAKAKAANLLHSSDPFTEPVVKGDKTLYRARFAGLKQDQAEAACRQLKRSDIVCMAIRN